MKKFWKIFLVIFVMFCVGVVGALFVNYVVFSKLATDSIWSENDVVKALSGKVTVIQNVEKVVVKDSESLLDISAQASAAVVHVESVLPNSVDREAGSGSGIIMSSDGIIAIHESLETQAIKYEIGFSDGTIREAKKVFEDEFSGIIFVQVEVGDLAIMPFSNSDDVVAGTKLINIYRERMSEQAFFASGVLSGFDYLFQTNEPSCDYLEGVFRVDFGQETLTHSLGSPMIDFNGEMIGMSVVNVAGDNFVIPSNDIEAAFDDFLKSNHESDGVVDESVDEDSSSVDINDEDLNDDRVILEASCKSVFKDQLQVDDSSVAPVNGVMISQTSSSQALNAKTFAQSNAAQLGLLEGDIILKIETDEVNAKNPVSKVLQNYKKGDEVKIELMRNGQILVLEDVKF